MWRRATSARILLLLLLGLEALGTAGALALDGTLTVGIREARAFKEDTDGLIGSEQDFWVCGALDNGPVSLWAPEVGDRDHASWSPAAARSKTVSGMNQRFFDFYFELWDADTFGNNTAFDISPQSGPNPPSGPCLNWLFQTGGFPHVTYDVCTGRMFVNGVNGSNLIPVGGANFAELNGAGTTNGNQDTWGALRFDVVKEPSNWLPDDVGIDDVQIVQSVYRASKAVADKETSLVVWVSSTYPMDLDVPVSGVLTDGLSTVNDSKMVHFEPGSLQNPTKVMVSLFDCTSSSCTNAPPFRPFKPQVIPGPSVGKVWGRADISYFETISPNAPPQLQDCANENNHMDAATLPLMRMSDLITVYQAFDYEEDLSFITSQQLQSMFNREEIYRLASWPLAALNSTPSFNQTWRDHGGTWLCPFEPSCTLVVYNLAAGMAGIDRLVLSVRNDWFGQNGFRHQFVDPNSIGLSLGPTGPRAVLAEDGFFGVAVHELGHTYDLSRYKCGTGGLDEYAHVSPPCNSPYAAVGFDVSGDVYPMGVHASSMVWPGLQCPATTPVPRDVCAPNFMNATPSWGYNNWIDTYHFQYLMESALPHIDPYVINVSGYVRFPDGQGDGTVAPAVEGALPFFAYQFMGIEDFTESPLSPMGEDFSGRGAFRVRLETPSGVRDYRFNPRLLPDPAASDQIGGFSINVLWDPMTTSIQLIGPTDARQVECENMLCPGDGLLLDQRPVTIFPPAVSALRAGLDAPAPVPPPGAPPETPTIGPGHQAVVSWESSDSDSPELRAGLILVMQDAAGGASGPPFPVAVDVSGSSFTIPHGRMTAAPGTYSGRLLVSDGVNTAETFQPSLFIVCNESAGGWEICDSIDNNCDGIVDNALNPGPVQMELNPQPFPPGGDEYIEWVADPNAQTYDIVMVDPSALIASGGDFTQAVVGCLAEDVTGNSFGPLPIPPLGGAYLFILRGNNCAGAGTYDSGIPEQAAPRDPGINASPVSCQPGPIQ